MGRKPVDKIIRESLKQFAKIAVRERGEIDRAAAALGLSRSAVEKMRLSGRGSVDAWIKLLAFRAGIEDEDFPTFITACQRAFGRIKPVDPIDTIIDELRSAYSASELAAWAKLLLAKKRIEDELGISIRASIRSKSKKKG